MTHTLKRETANTHTCGIKCEGTEDKCRPVREGGEDWEFAEIWGQILTLTFVSCVIRASIF